MSYGVGVEKVFPVHSPSIDKIETVRHGYVRRAKLYYLRDRVGKAAKLREKLFSRSEKRHDRLVMPFFRVEGTGNMTFYAYCFSL